MYIQTRTNETTQRGQKYRTKPKFDYAKAPYFKGRDYPWNVEDIPTQLKEFNPRWIIWMLDVESYEDPLNWDIIKTIISEMDLGWYRKKNTPKYVS